MYNSKFCSNDNHCWSPQGGWVHGMCKASFMFVCFLNANKIVGRKDILEFTVLLTANSSKFPFLIPPFFSIFPVSQVSMTQWNFSVGYHLIQQVKTTILFFFIFWSRPLVFSYWEVWRYEHWMWLDWLSTQLVVCGIHMPSISKRRAGHLSSCLTWRLIGNKSLIEDFRWLLILNFLNSKLIAMNCIIH